LHFLRLFSDAVSTPCHITLTGMRRKSWMLIILGFRKRQCWIYYSVIRLERQRKIIKNNLVRIAARTAKIQIKYSPDISLDCYCYTKLFSGRNIN
jgi:hypothetical protein